MSVKAFLSDDNYENGNYHYKGRVAGRYASSLKEGYQPSNLQDELVEAVPRIMPSLMANYFLLKTVDKLTDKIGDMALSASQPDLEPWELPKATIGIATPAALLQGFFSATNKGRLGRLGVLSSALRAIK